ncbi:MAG: aldo/keto reductase [Lachnospiraceae bacterium]|nr:aldo/keto reductase [Lachnospiraceae bacterium]
MTNPFFEKIRGRFGFGCMRMQMKGGEVDLELFQAMVDRFLEQGFNYFDTAHGYLGGKSETALRQCLVERYPRDAYVLTNKISTHFFQKAEEIRPLFLSQLEACGVDRFDFCLMHAQDGDIYEKFRRCRVYETALELKAEGRFDHFGISFHDKADVLERILNDWPEIEVVQIQLNYADYESAAVESRKVYEVCERFGKPVIVMEPVKGGCLVDLPADAQKVFDELQEGVSEKNSNASYALRFAAGLPNVCVVLSGMNDMAQMEDNIRSMRDLGPLTSAEAAAVDRVREIFTSLDMIPCTSCHYCVLDNDCPAHIRIPELFSCYNLKTTFRNWNQDYYYDHILTRDAGKASDCLKCGKCEKICPQHLAIRDLLENVAAEFESQKK